MENEKTRKRNERGLIPIQVETTLTKEDFWNLNKYVLWNKQRKTVLTMLFGYPVVLFLLFMIMDYAIWICIAAALVLGGGSLWFFYYRFKGRVMKVPVDNPALLGTQSFEIGAEGFWESTSANRTFTEWQGIESIEQNNEYIVVFVSRMHCHLLPKRDFASPAQAEEFYRTAIGYWQAGRSGGRNAG
ncbi:YcxB family protein [Cohnella thailandensis]|uniref:YcxB family protein n=1 Tax=Cohnella thailandensis TaxID=557557 RepID=A0A841T1X2_9BACL|nr:YcxB family protein [Cohnella thailandensis]MBB6638393.1 YcxB family protein [Cohnella thailandensis]MBP1977129.1 hypothetical protein [Cohnella thailandensis]